MKVHLRMVGCRLNQSEIDTMSRQFSALGHDIVAAPEEADKLVVNTCAVTNEATKTSRKLIRDFKRSNPNGKTTVTGCYAQIAPEEIRHLPGVERVIDNGSKSKLVSLVTGESVDEFDVEPIDRSARPGSFGKTRAFVKVQDGCDNACTFCITTIARGVGRSRSIREVVREVKYLEQCGYQEAVLTGVHLGSYGHDIGDRHGLRRLVEALLAETSMPRIRLSSLEPWDLAPGFFELWQNRRLCRHLHLPLQSGCDATLRRMRRHTSQRQFRALLDSARDLIPEVRITTDVIVGFPGESAHEFAESERFVREMEFGGLHVFRYSSRPGTPASRMKQQVSNRDKKARSAKLLALSDTMERRFAERLLGSRQSVLWEQVIGATPAGFAHSGYTDNYMRVRAIHPRNLSNIVTCTRLNTYTDGEIRGTVEDIEAIPGWRESSDSFRVERGVP